MDTFTKDRLIVLLRKHQLNTSSWVKPVSSLFKEIENGECTLEVSDNDFIRRVDVIVVYCYHLKDGRKLQLYEEKQVFKNGTIRHRGFDYVAEKMQSNETPIDAAHRGIREELGISVASIEPKDRSSEMCMSPTYTGICCVYNRYHFTAYISEADYRDEYIEVQDDKTTYFKWK